MEMNRGMEKKTASILFCFQGIIKEELLYGKFGIIPEFKAGMNCVCYSLK
jgi:hypothetical protein